jgi:hypothetical protein
LFASGAGSTVTGPFPITTAGWEVRWSYTCSAATAGNAAFGVFVHNNSGILTGDFVRHLGAQGAGVARFRDGPGTFALAVTSRCAWTISVATA